MGMFDNLIVNYPLPINPPDTDWQTKSLDCQLDEYIIDKDGYLLLKSRWKEIVANLHKYDQTNSISQRVDETGEIRFYTHIDINALMVDIAEPGKLTDTQKFIIEHNLPQSDSVWIEYAAFFISGKIDNIVLYNAHHTGDSIQKQKFKPIKL